MVYFAAMKATRMLLLYGMFVTSKAAVAGSSTESTTIATTASSISPIQTSSPAPSELAFSDHLWSNVPSPPIITVTPPTLATVNLAKATVVTEPVRHGLGRGFPIPHYYLPTDPRRGPFFEDGSKSENITVRVGSTIMINCRIGLLQNKTVTWLHHKGDSIHLLTVGRSVYSRDERITLSFRYPNNYRLHIVYITRRDDGLYECQVATHPPKVKKIFLKVTAPELRIVDESGRKVTERYYKAGSALELTCLATQVGVTSEDHPITWRHGDRTLSKGIRSTVSNITDSAVSSLTVAPLDTLHSGNYTCAVGALAFATVAVHVLNGELPAAVHHGNAATSHLALPALVFILAGWLHVHRR